MIDALLNVDDEDEDTRMITVSMMMIFQKI